MEGVGPKCDKGGEPYLRCEVCREIKTTVLTTGRLKSYFCLFLIFLIDGMGWLIFVMTYFPVICLLGSLTLIFYGIWRKRNKLPCLQTFVLAIILLLVPIAFVIFLFLIGALGLGPVPT